MGIRHILRVRLFPLMLIVPLALLAGCDYGTVSFPTPTPDCAHTLRCDLIVPPCGPAVTSSHFYNGFWVRDFAMPSNAASFLGFTPQLPTQLPRYADFGTMPTATISSGIASPLPTQPLPPTVVAWYQVTILRQATPHGGPPLLHASYILFPRLGRDTCSVLAFDETEASLDPLSNLNDPDPTSRSGEATFFVKDRQAVHLATQPATLATIYHLGVAGFPTARADELIWTSGTLTMRLVVGVTSGIREFATAPTYPGGNSYVDLDAIEGSLLWDDASATMLQRVAASVAPFTCPA